jgi:hypothetical protein
MRAPLGLTAKMANCSIGRHPNCGWPGGNCIAPGRRKGDYLPAKFA